MYDLKKLFTNYTGNYSGFKKQSAVIIPIVSIKGILHVIFEKRAPHLKSQPNEICFPGGTLDAHESPEEAAIRETCEELNIDSTQIEVIGRMDSLATHFDMLIHCFIAYIHEDYNNISPSKDEVAYIFAVPLEEILESAPERHILHANYKPSDDFPFRDIPQGKNYNFKNRDYEVLFYPKKKELIWGLTAKLLHQFSKFILSKIQS